MIKTTPPTDAADTAMAQQVADGTASPQQALEYFQGHGYPFLSAPPTWHAEGRGGHWDFPGASLVTAHRGRPEGSGTDPVTFFVALDQGAPVARPGMTESPSRTHDPGGGVTGFGGIGGPLIATRPPTG
jgi:hypothetical protein